MGKNRTDCVFVGDSKFSDCQQNGGKNKTVSNAEQPNFRRFEQIFVAIRHGRRWGCGTYSLLPAALPSKFCNQCPTLIRLFFH